METKNLSFDEIVFEKRNKDYGAFRLRKIYTKVVARAFFFGTTFFLMVLAVPLIASYMNKNKIILGNNVTIDFGLTKPDPVLPPDPPKPPDPIISEERVAFTAPIATYDSVELADLGKLIGETENPKVEVKKEEEFVISNEGTEIINVVKEETYLLVSLMPSFIGGETEMYRYLSENIKYPIAAKEAQISGTVFVTFVVEKDGSITGVQTLRDIGGGCGAEAIRVVSAMPKWNIGKQNGVPVRVQFNLPIQFSLQ